VVGVEGVLRLNEPKGGATATLVLGGMTGLLTAILVAEGLGVGFATGTLVVLFCTLPSGNVARNSTPGKIFFFFSRAM